MSGEIAAFEVEKLRGAATVAGTEVAVSLAGTASQRDIDALEAFLGTVLQAAEGGAAGRIVVDLRDVAYMNSSHFKVLVAWIGRVGKAVPPVAVVLRGNRDFHWQKRSLDALRNLAESWVTVES